MKFKNFSTHIVPTTNFLMIFLLILSIVGFVIIFYINSGSSEYNLNNSTKNIQNTEIKNEDKNYQDEIIGDDYY